MWDVEGWKKAQSYKTEFTPGLARHRYLHSEKTRVGHTTPRTSLCRALDRSTAGSLEWRTEARRGRDRNEALASQ